MSDAPERPDEVTVHSDDTLRKLAKELFEDSSRWRSIYDANRDVMSNPDDLRPGMELRLPMEIYPSHLRSVAGNFETERGELAGAFAAAAAELNAIGDFWGQSQEGTTFAKGQGGDNGYEAVLRQAMEGGQVFTEAHEGIVTRLRQMADRTEAANWEILARILSKLPGG